MRKPTNFMDRRLDADDAVLDAPFYKGRRSFLPVRLPARA